MTDTRETADSAPHVPSPPERAASEKKHSSVPGDARWGTWALAAVTLLLLLSSGLVGALLALRLQPSTPPLRIAIVDTTKIAEAVAEASQHDAGLVGRFPQRFDALIRQLQEAEPQRLFLVREAVIGTGWEDITPLILQDLREQAPLTPSLPSAAPPASKGSSGRPHAP